MSNSFVVGQKVRILRGRHARKEGVITNIDTFDKYNQVRTVDIELPLDDNRYFYRSKDNDRRKMYTKMRVIDIESCKEEKKDKPDKVNRLLMVNR